jgi:hypothetical protein
MRMDRTHTTVVAHLGVVIDGTKWSEGIHPVKNSNTKIPIEWRYP